MIKFLMNSDYQATLGLNIHVHVPIYNISQWHGNMDFIFE